MDFRHSRCSASLEPVLLVPPPKTGGERKMTLAQTPKNCDSEEASRKKLHTLL